MTSTQILPQFDEVRAVPKCDAYAQIYAENKIFKIAWLLDEGDSIWKFIERLAEADEKNSSEEPLNLYDFYVAYNIKFPAGTVALTIGKKILRDNLGDLSGLLKAVIRAGEKIFAVHVPSSALKLKILQQFIFLRIWLPIIAENPSPQKTTGDIGIFGTKKAGKSALINALLGYEYAVSSPVVPTPNKIIYTAAKSSDEISLAYRNSTRKFNNADALRNFLADEFSAANKNSATLPDMKIAVPNFPDFLHEARLIDTPGSNFAAAKNHADITEKTLSQVAHAVFVMNYSQYLTRDEINLFDAVYKQFNNAKVQRPILIAINRVDEIFDSEESKSYERVADYICNRLNALGYKNFLVVSVSAIQSVYFAEIARLLEPSAENFNVKHIIKRIEKFFRKNFGKQPPLRNRLKKLQANLRGSNKITAVVFVINTISDFEDFHGITIENIGDLQKIDRINYFKCLIRNMIAGAL